MKKTDRKYLAYKELYVFYAHSIPFNGDTLKKQPLGGSETAVISMASALQRTGKKVMVFTATDEPGTYDGVEYCPLASFMTFIQKTIIDVFVAVRDPQVLELPIRSRVSVLWAHDAHDQPHMQLLSSPDVRKKIDVLITVSQWQADQYREHFHFDAAHIFVSRNGIHKNLFRKYSKKRKKRLVYTSTPFRGLDLLLECFPFIRHYVPDCELAIFSSMKVYGMNEADDQARFGHLYEQCKQPGVTWFGSVPQEMLARELSGSSLFVYPNYFAETSCIAALEAQAAGLPVIASALGALKETIVHGETGTLVPGDVRSVDFKREFVRAVVAYLKDEALWNRHSVRAHERVMKLYDWNRIAEEWIAYFDAARPTLSLCMIVKNEEKRIADMLSAIEPYVDEMIIVDTGSDDDTCKIVKTFGKAKLYHYKWNNDFSRPRNFSLLKATGNWILVLDADERISDEDFLFVRRLMNVKDAAAYKLLQRSYTNDATIAGWKAASHEDRQLSGFAGYHDSYLVRLFRNGCGFSFDGRVHETVEASISERSFVPTNTNIPIHHFGKTGNKEVEKKKGELYLGLGKGKIDDRRDDPAAYRELAIQHAELGAETEALSLYEKALDLMPDDAISLSNAAVLYMKRNDAKKALEYLERAIALRPDYIPAYVNAALVYKAKGDLKQAKDCLQKALDRDSKQPLIWKELAIISMLQQHYARACDYLKKVRALSEQDYLCDDAAYAYYKCAKTLAQNRDLVCAERYLDEAIRIKKLYPEAMNDRGVVFVKKGEYDKAHKQFEEVITVCSMDPAYSAEVVTAHINLGYIENYLQNFNQALIYLSKAIEIDEHQTEAFNHLGIAHCGLGNLPEAAQYFEKALALDQHHQAARINLQRIKELFVKDANACAEQGK